MVRRTTERRHARHRVQRPISDIRSCGDSPDKTCRGNRVAQFEPIDDVQPSNHAPERGEVPCGVGLRRFAPLTVACCATKFGTSLVNAVPTSAPDSVSRTSSSIPSGASPAWISISISPCGVVQIARGFGAPLYAGTIQRSTMAR